MSEVFASLRTVHARGRLAIPDADVIAGYLGSLQSLPELGDHSPGSDVFSDLVEVARRRAQATIDREGTFEVHTHAGVFVAQGG